MANEADAARRMRNLGSYLYRARAAIAAIEADGAGPGLADAVREEYVGLVRDVPVLEGSTFRINLEVAAYYFAIARALRRRGFSTERAGLAIWKAQEAHYRSFPRFVLKAYTGISMSHLKHHGKSESEKLVRLGMPGDWRFDYKPGVRGSLLFGMSFTECGIVKLAKALGEGDIVPWMCRLDYLSANLCGYAFRRTGTLAEGFPCCDNEFLGKGETAWPVPFDIESKKEDLKR